MQDRYADMFIVVGTSRRLGMHQIQVDYLGDPDMTRLWQGIAWWVNRALRSVPLPRIILSILASRHERDCEGPEKTRRTAKFPTQHDCAEPSDWRAAISQAAPVDPQYPPTRRPRRQGQGQAGAQNTKERRLLPPVFAAVLAHTNTTALATLARSLAEARCRDPRVTTMPAQVPVPLPRISAPFLGGAHVFYNVRFEAGAMAGVEWIVKIPIATGVSADHDEKDGKGEGKGKDVWDEQCRETLRAEALLLHLLRMETRVPVPEVIDADCRVRNEVGVPWLLMEFVRGKRLEDVWFGSEDRGGDGDWGRDKKRRGEYEYEYECRLKTRREKILADLARIMFQLGNYEFDQGGALAFDQSDGQLVGAGPLRELDVHAMVDRWFSGENRAPTPLYRSMGPWNHVQDMYTAWLDVCPPTDQLGRGVGELLRLLLGQIREPILSNQTGARKGKELPLPSTSSSSRPSKNRGGLYDKTPEKTKPFVLVHPDLSMRNILLGEDGTTIKAILGWDGARAAPRSLGNEALPRWLVRDFDPFVWQWRPPPPSGHATDSVRECNRFEDPPWVLRELRGYYARVIRELMMGWRERGGEEEEGTNGLEKNKKNRGYGEGGVVDITKQSLFALTLDAAARDPRRRVATLRRVLEKLSRPFEELDFDFFVDALGNGYEVDAVRLKSMQRNIEELIDKGFVRGAVVW